MIPPRAVTDFRRTAARGCRSCGAQDGFAALLLVFAMAAAAAIMLYLEMPRILFEGQREKEDMLIQRGEQYKRGIQLFVRKNQRYPATMEELERFQDRRYLRRRYRDPLTGKDEWRLIHFENGSFRDSLVYKQKDPLEKEGQKSPGLVTETAFLNNQPEGTGTAVAPGLGRRASDRPAAQSGMPQPGMQPGGAGQPVDPNQPPQQDLSEAQQFLQHQQQQQNQQQNPGHDPNQPLQANVPPTTLPIQPGQPGVPGQGFPVQPGQVPVQPGQVPGQPGIPFQPGQQLPVQPGMPGQLPPGYQQGQPFPVQPGQRGSMPAVPFVPGQPNPFQQQQQQAFQQAIQQGQQQQGGQSFIGGGGSQPFIGGALTPQPAPGQPGYRPGQPQQAQFGQGAPQVPVSSQAGGAYPVPGRGGVGPAGGSNAAVDMIRNILTTPRPGGMPGMAQGGQAGLGSGIAGVASKVDSEGIKIYAEKTNYKEWEFIYDPSKDESAKLSGQGMTQGPGGQQQGRPGQGAGQGLGPGMGPGVGPGVGQSGLGPGPSTFGRPGQGQQPPSSQPANQPAPFIGGPPPAPPPQQGRPR